MPSPPLRGPDGGARQCLLIGALLLVAGVLCWASGLDMPLHVRLRLAARSGWIADLSFLGGFAVEGPLALLGVAFLALRRRTFDAVWLLLGIASGRLAVEALKLAVARARPPLADRLETVTSWSFPSSHSAGTMMTGVLLAAIFCPRAPGFATAVAFAAAIGGTRIALGVHWPGDVLAGWGIGLIWAGFALLLRRYRRGPAPG